jgi:regulator of Ty1 transposition protein 103
MSDMLSHPQAGPEKRLSFLYLANDMLQNGRKKAPELAAEFYRVLPRALKTMHKAGIAKDIARVKR